MFEKDSIVAGILLGVIIPFIGYAFWLEIYDQLEARDLIEGFYKGDFRRRTSALLGICLNLIPFIYFNRNRFNNSMRGVMFPTIIYGFIWFFVFGIKIMN